MIRLAQLVLALAAVGLWAASRMTWVEVTSSDGLGQPRTTALAGGSWSTALVPTALLLVAAAVAALAVRGWPLRLLAVLVAAAGAAMAYVAISLWAVGNVAVRAADLADFPVVDLVGSRLHPGGAVVTLVAAALTVVGAVVLMRSARAQRAGPARFARRARAVPQDPATMSERMLWDALDEGHDPTIRDNKGR